MEQLPQFLAKGLKGKFDYIKPINVAEEVIY